MSQDDWFDALVPARTSFLKADRRLAAGCGRVCRGRKGLFHVTSRQPWEETQSSIREAADLLHSSSQKGQSERSEDAESAGVSSVLC